MLARHGVRPRPCSPPSSFRPFRLPRQTSIVYQDSEMFSRRFCQWLAAGYVLGVMPWCLIALILKYSYIPYSVARHVTVSLGAVVLMRAWLGPEWVIKAAYSVRWLLTMDILRRDDIGNAFVAGAGTLVFLRFFRCIRV